MRRLILLFTVAGSALAFAQGWSDFSTQTASTILSAAMNGKVNWQVSATAPASTASPRFRLAQGGFHRG